MLGTLPYIGSVCGARLVDGRQSKKAHVSIPDSVQKEKLVRKHVLVSEENKAVFQVELEHL